MMTEHFSFQLKLPYSTWKDIWYYHVPLEPTKFPITLSNTDFLLGVKSGNFVHVMTTQQKFFVTRHLLWKMTFVISLKNTKKSLTFHRDLAWRVASMQLLVNVTPNVTQTLARFSCRALPKNRNAGTIHCTFSLILSFENGM
jgi:hypothetical protein